MTLQQIYAYATHETAPHGKTLAAELSRESHRRQRIVEAYKHGMSMHAIAANLGVSHASVRSAIVLTMRAIRKRVLGLPRYHQSGRGRQRLAPAA
jgi:DNA-binding NarL/FixJ family response regulator